MSKNNIKVTKQSETGRNLEFNINGQKKTVQQFVEEIKDGKHKGYHVAKINGKETPRSNPDKRKKNNLG